MMKRVRTPVLMIVHAHPDNESSQTGGTLARYAAAGCRTVLVTCTDGANGDDVGGAKPGQAGHDPRRVAERRSMELDSAADALGVVDLVKLGYLDSGISDGDGQVPAESFSARPPMPMVSQMVRLMRLYEPDVVITYPPNGLSGHPDHVRTHELVVAAHGNVVANGEPDGRVPRPYYIAMSVSSLREVQAGVRAAFGEDAWVPPAGLGIDDDEITTVIDVTPFWAAKLSALAAHASQPDAALLLEVFAVGAAAVETVVRVEQYVQAYPPLEPARGGIEHDFFTPQRPPRSSGTSTACC